MTRPTPTPDAGKKLDCGHSVSVDEIRAVVHEDVERTYCLECFYSKFPNAAVNDA